MRLSLLALLLAAVAALPQAHAQAVVDVRSTCDTNAPGLPCNTTARSVFRVQDDGSVVAPAQIGVGLIPMTGAGDRMMWHGSKAAFRSGGVDGVQWDDGNVGYYSTGFGFNTVAFGNYTFASGYNARAYLSYATAIGYLALAKGVGAVAIGYRTTADGDYSVALGHRASANGFDGAFVIADQSTTDSLEASTNNQFNSRYAGGYRLYTNATTTVGVQINAGGSSWQVISDRNRKEDFAAFDAEALLGRIAQMPLSTWHYRDTETTDRHIGPMAQDWHALVSGPLGLNSDSLTINQGDFDGVNLAGIQALEARTRTLAEENAALRAELAGLRGETAAVRAEAERLRTEAAALREARAEDAARFARLEAAVARLATDEEAGTVTASVER